MDNVQLANLVKQGLDREISINKLKSQLFSLGQAKVPDPPFTKLKVNKLHMLGPLAGAFLFSLLVGMIWFMVLLPLALLWIPVYLLFFHWGKATEHKKNAKATPEYTNAVSKWVADNAIRKNELEKQITHLQDVQSNFFNTDLQMPDTHRYQVALSFIYNAVAQSGMGLDEAINAYDQEQYANAERERIRKEQRLYAQESTSSSGGGGMGFVKTTGAVIAGNKITDMLRNDGSGRQNLLGTPGCAISQGKNSICVIGCKQLQYCTQRGRFKVGA